MPMNAMHHTKAAACSLVLLLSFLPATARSQTADGLVPPEIVHAEIVHHDGNLKTVIVSNATNHYVLSCSVEASGCLSPKPDVNYLLFNKNTRWKMPGATDFITLQFVQNWTVAYKNAENIGLVPEKGGGQDDIGIYMLEKENYANQYVMTTDGPIIFGAGLNDEDFANAWKYFFILMIKACAAQQGKDVLELKLARRCQPGDDFCVTALDANLTGIAGIQEPRKVLVLVTTDLHDDKKQLARIVCTYPAKNVTVCRNWSTGKLISDE